MGYTTREPLSWERPNFPFEIGSFLIIKGISKQVKPTTFPQGKL